MTEIETSRHRLRLGALFFLQSHAQALWYVPFSSVLRAHGLDWLTPYAFASTALAAIVSPMIGGALADEHLPPERILGALFLSVATMLVAVFVSIERGWGGGWVLGLLLVQQLLLAPVSSLVVAIVLASLHHPEREYGPIRVWATYGWLVAVPLLALVVRADSSTETGYVAAGAFLVVAIFTCFLPVTHARRPAVPRRWRELLGSDTLLLLRDRDVRTVYWTAALFSIPLAAFYPFTPLFLADAGDPSASAKMSLGQATEVIATYALAPLLARVRVKWLLLAGLGFGVLRYALFALNARPWILVGISMHGFCYILYFVSAQLFLERRIPSAYRARAQAFLSLMMLGVGTFIGSLACGWLRVWCAAAGGTRWSLYWSILSGSVALVGVYFVTHFRDHPPVRVEAEPAERPAGALGEWAE